MPSDAFSATYSDWKLIRTRAVVQIVLEVPIEDADHAYNVLGGMPNSAREIWVGVARFKPGTEVMPPEQSKPTEKPPASEDSTTPARARKSWQEMKLAEQSAVLCHDPAFRRFLAEYCAYEGIAVLDLDMAIEGVRGHCGVTSRKDIRPGTWAGDKWGELVGAYRTWQLAAQVVPT